MTISRLWIMTVAVDQPAYGLSMRWDKLFDDLESQLEREMSADEIGLGVEEERLRLGRLSLRDRLASIHGGAPDHYVLPIALSDGSRLSVHPTTVGRDWFAADVVDGSVRRIQCVIPLASVVSIAVPAERLPDSLAEVDDRVGHPSLAARLSLAFVLRDLCRRRAAVDVVLTRLDLHGTIDRVGRDHLDLAVHERGSVRRASNVSEVRMLPLASIVLVRL